MAVKQYNSGFVPKNCGSFSSRAEKSLRLRKNLRTKDKIRLKGQITYRKGLDRFMGAKAYQQILMMNKEVLQLQKDHKVNLLDVAEVEERVNQYLAIIEKYSNKPTVAGLALSLGIDRNKLGQIMSGRNQTEQYPIEVREYLHQIYVLYESLWEQYMLDGDIPPANGMFIGKNQFGYKDVVEHEIIGEIKPVIDVKSIEERYKYIGGDNELPPKSGAEKDSSENES